MSKRQRSNSDNNNNISNERPNINENVSLFSESSNEDLHALFNWSNKIGIFKHLFEIKSKIVDVQSGIELLEAFKKTRKLNDIEKENLSEYKNELIDLKEKKTKTINFIGNERLKNRFGKIIEIDKIGEEVVRIILDGNNSFLYNYYSDKLVSTQPILPTMKGGIEPPNISPKNPKDKTIKRNHGNVGQQNEEPQNAAVINLLNEFNNAANGGKKRNRKKKKTVKKQRKSKKKGKTKKKN
jgi:hypothetical protein